jgi:heptosyltransferase-2
MSRILVIQTAFAGDLVLTLPLVQELRATVDGSNITVLCIPSTAPLLARHPAVDSVIVYDKRNHSPSLTKLGAVLRAQRFDMVVCPHRSLRSALLARVAGARIRVGFDLPVVRRFYTHRAAYVKTDHEVLRNLSLLAALGMKVNGCRRPELYPGPDDEAAAAAIAREFRPELESVVIAPGSVWATKRWTPEGFAAVAAEFSVTHNVVLAGGREDEELCRGIARMSKAPVIVAAGRLSFTASAALIRSAALLISNDSAPVHLASAVGTPVVEIYGATVPEFGFTPYGVPYRLVQMKDLECRPCGIHGARQCPIKTFECMKNLAASTVIEAARCLLQSAFPGC